MCGILGLTGGSVESAKNALATFSYRGPDASKVMEEHGVVFGHNRLSIIDLDERATQPMSDTSGTLRIVFNGEIYNYKELRRDLEASGYSFRTESDTEVLLYAYAAWGEDFVTRLRGMYAFAIHDKARQSLFLATDHANMKPIFYVQVGSRFMFASELKGILSMMKDLGAKLVVDREALSLFWALGYVSVPHTIYKGVWRMPRATRMKVDLTRHTIEHSTYALSADAVDTSERLAETIERAVERHLVADVPVGLFFSGGTDSSLIAAILAKKGKALEAFSLEIDQRPEDRSYFEAIGKELKLHVHPFFFGIKEFDDVYPIVARHIDEPFYDSSLFPTFFIAREARKHVKVVLSGDAGDEYFLGYPTSVRLSRMHGARIDGDMGLFDYVYVYTPRFRGKAHIFARIFEFLKKPVSCYLMAVSPAKDFLSAREWRIAKRALAARTKEAVMLDRDHYLENDILRKVDLATMYNSLEGRIPLLDPEVIASAEYMMNERVPLMKKKPLLKEILSMYLPKEQVYRGKRGFGLDANVYFANSTYLKKDLSDGVDFLKERNLLSPRTLMPLETLIKRRSQMAWQILFLYHAVKNAGL